MRIEEMTGTQLIRWIIKLERTLNGVNCAAVVLEEAIVNHTKEHNWIAHIMRTGQSLHHRSEGPSDMVALQTLAKTLIAEADARQKQSSEITNVLALVQEST